MFKAAISQAPAHRGWAIQSKPVSKLTLLWAVLALSVGGQIFAQAETVIGFAPVARYNTSGPYAFTMVSGDFNGDGAPDIAATGWYGATVLFNLNDGSGKFAAPVTVYPHTTEAVACGDFNGDGKLDLVFGEYNAVTILYNDGTGSFSTSANIPGVVSATRLIAADFNGDGKTDLAGVHSLANYLFVVINNGAGGFLPPVFNYGIGAGPRNIISADLNGDNRPDLAITMSENSEAFSLALLLNNGSGGFPSVSFVNVQEGAQGLASGDFNGDSQVDLAVGGHVLLGNGDGSFGVKYLSGIGTDYSLVTADLDSDGDADLIGCGQYSGSTITSREIHIVAGDGAGDFGSRQTITETTSLLALVTEDFNDDGKADLAVSLNSLRQVSVYLNASSVPPEIDLNGPATGTGVTLAVTEGDDPAILAPDLTLSDDGATLWSATVSITNRLDGAKEVLDSPGGAGLSVSYSPATGILNIRGEASLATYQAALRGVTYQNFSQEMDTTERLIDFKVNDLGNDSNTATASVSLSRAGSDIAYVVNTLLDGTGSASEFTLREAITAANADAGSETITFEEGLVGTIALSSALPSLNDDVIIRGPGADLLTVERSGSALYRIFTVAATPRATVSGLTISNGNSSTEGGGIRNAGNLTVIDCTIKGNTTATLGGGIYSSGKLTVTGTLLTANIAASGSGIYSSTDLAGLTTTLTNMTISGNAASVGGGGLFNASGLSIIQSCTITANTAPPGAGSGIANSGDVISRTELANSIISGNSNSDLDLVGGIDNSFLSNGYNLVGSGSGISAIIAPGDLPGIIDPRLGGLQDNGGPTRTHSPQSDSPVLDAGSTALTVDQRGSLRPQADAPDIGAVEVDPFVFDGSLIVTTLADENNGTSTPAYGTGTSLREAIIFANSNADHSIITFSPGLSGIINVTEELPALSSDISIQGPGARRMEVRGPGQNNYAACRIFTVPEGATVSISGLTISRGFAFGFSTAETRGGGVHNLGTLTLSNCSVKENVAHRGAIYNLGDMTISACTVSGNTHVSGLEFLNFALSVGILTEGGSLTVMNSTISGNLGGAATGGIVHTGGQTLISSCTISGNLAANPLFLANGLLAAAPGVEVENSIIAGNNGKDVAVLYEDDSIQSNGHNLIGLGNASGHFTATDDQTGVSPNLGALADNGGPTNTHLPLAGSPAINVGSTAQSLDQRGAQRSSGGVDDVGAVEVIPAQSGSSIVVTSLLDDADDGVADAFDTSLREAINAANSDGGLTVITFASGLTGTIELTRALPEITTNMDINGPGAPGIVIRRSSGGNYRIFKVAASRRLTLYDLTLSNGVATGASPANRGGGIFNSGLLLVYRCTLSGNSAAEGGAIYNDGIAAVVNSTLSGNVASLSAGALYSDASAGGVNLQSSTISDNSGGAVTAMNGVVNVENSIIANNGPNQLDFDSVNYFVSDGYNIIGTNGGPGAASFIATGDLTNTDPLLGALADNGGPTKTHALLFGSPAIDSGSTSQNIDQRGTTRPQGIAKDIGPLEYIHHLITTGQTLTFDAGGRTSLLIQELLDSILGGGGPLSLVSVSSTGIAGSSVWIEGGYIIYQSAPGQKGADTFTYEVTDGTLSVTASITTAHNPELLGLTLSNSGAGSATIYAAGIPGESYLFNYSPTMDSGTWLPVGSPVICPPDGLMSITEAGPLPETRFYQLVFTEY